MPSFKFLLKIGHITFIIPVILILTIFGDRNVPFQALSLLSYGMIIHNLLRFCFTFSLLPQIEKKQLLPSELMYEVALFYGFLIYKVNNQIVQLTFFIFLSIFAASLVYFQYHTVKEVVFAIVFSLLELILFHLVSLGIGFGWTGIFALDTAALILVILRLVYHLEKQVWMAFYLLISSLISLSYFHDVKFPNLEQQLLGFGVIGVILILLYFFFKWANFNRNCVSQFYYALVPFLIIYGIQKLSSYLNTPETLPFRRVHDHSDWKPQVNDYRSPSFLQIPWGLKKRPSMNLKFY